MAFFAVLEPGEPTDGDFDVERCHINAWSLPGFLGHRPMVFDVGLMFVPKTDAMRQVEFALPLRTAPHVVDLRDPLFDSSTAALIFGKSFERVDTRSLELKLKEGQPAEKVTLLALDDQSNELKPNDDELTVAKLALASRPAAGERSYIRARFIVDDPGTMWRWQRVLGRRHGLLIDFRAPDPREESRPERKALEDRAKPMAELDVFFIVPERYRLLAANPDLKYTRTLEGKVWRHYLRRSIHGLSVARRNHGRLMVHRWHPEDKGEPTRVDGDNPFRGFLQLGREPAFRAPSDLLLGSLITALLIFALFRPLSLRSGIVDAGDSALDALNGISTLVLAVLGGLTALTVITLAIKAIKNRKLPLTMAHKAKRMFKKAEYGWFKRAG